MGCCSNKAPNTADASTRPEQNQKESLAPLPYEPEPAPSCHSQEVADVQGFLSVERRPTESWEDVDLRTVEEGQSAGLLPARKLEAPSLAETHQLCQLSGAVQNSKAPAGEPLRALPQPGGTVLLGRTKALLLVAGLLALVAMAGWRLRSSGGDESEASKVLVAAEHPEWGPEGFTTTTTTTTITWSTTTVTRSTTTTTRSTTRTSTTATTTTLPTTSLERTTTGREELAPASWLGQGQNDSRDLHLPVTSNDMNDASDLGGSGITNQSTVFSTYKPPTTTNTTTVEATLPTTSSADMAESGSTTAITGVSPSAGNATPDATNAWTVALGTGSNATSDDNGSVWDQKPTRWPLSMSAADWKAVAAIASNIAAWKAAATEANTSTSTTEAQTSVLGTSADNQSLAANASSEIDPAAAANRTRQYGSAMLGAGAPEGSAVDNAESNGTAAASLPFGMSAAQAAGLPLGMSASEWRAVAAITARIARWRAQAVEARQEQASSPVLGMSIGTAGEEEADANDFKDVEEDGLGSRALMLGTGSPDQSKSFAASAPQFLGLGSPGQSSNASAANDLGAAELPFGMTARQWSVVTALAAKVAEWKGMNSSGHATGRGPEPAVDVDFSPVDNESLRQMEDMEEDGGKHKAWSMGLSKGAKAGLGVGVPLGVATLLGGLLGGLLGTTATTTLTSSGAMLAPEMLATTTQMLASTTLGNFSLGTVTDGTVGTDVAPARKLPDGNSAQSWCTSWWIALAVVPLLLACICLYFVLRPRVKRTRAADDARLLSQDGASPCFSMSSSPEHTTQRSGEWDFSMAANVTRGCCGFTAAEFADEEDTHPQASAVHGLYDTIDRDGKGYITKSDFKSAPVAARAAATAAMAGSSSVSFVTQMSNGSQAVPGVGAAPMAAPAPMVAPAPMAAPAPRVGAVAVARQQHFVEPVAVPPQPHFLPSVAPRQV